MSGTNSTLAPRPAQLERHRVGELVAVRHRDRLHLQVGQRQERAARRHLAQRDLLQRHQLAPRPVAAQETGQARADPHRQPGRRRHLAPELGQPEVVADVGMGHEHGVDRPPAALADAGQGVQPRHLLLDRGSRFDQEQGTGAGVVHAEAGRGLHAAGAPCAAAAQLALAPEVRHAAVLGPAEHEQAQSGRSGGSGFGRARSAASGASDR